MSSTPSRKLSLAHLREEPADVLLAYIVARQWSWARRAPLNVVSQQANERVEVSAGRRLIRGLDFESSLFVKADGRKRVRHNSRP